MRLYTIEIDYVGKNLIRVPLHTCAVCSHKKCCTKICQMYKTISYLSTLFYVILQSTYLMVNSLTGGSWISFRYVPNYNKAILQKRGTGT